MSPATHWTIVVLCLVGAPSSAAGQDRELTFYQDVAWSPDGTRLAFSAMKVSQARWQKESYAALGASDYDLYVMWVDGSDPARLTDNPRYDLWVAWSPDGRRLVFGSDRDGNTDLYVMNADGSSLTRLTRDAGEESAPSWSPDGTRIAFSSKQTDRWHLWMMNADGSAARQLTTAAADHWNPVWSPDGTRLVYYANPSGPGRDQIFVMDLAGPGSARALAEGVFPAWSPDGRSVIYGHQGKLFMIGADGSNRRRLAEKSEFGRWSPDGRRIAFVMGDFPDTAIYLMNGDGTGRQRLTR